MIDLEKKQKVWADQLPLFKDNYILTSDLDLLEFDMINGQFDIKPNQGNDGFDDEDSLVLYHSVNTAWAMWLRCNRLNKAEIESLKDKNIELQKKYQYADTQLSDADGYFSLLKNENEQLKAKLAKIESGEFVIVPKSELDTCYLDENEGMYLTHSDFLAEINIGEVVEVKRQYYWETTSLFAAIAWDEANNDVGYYELFDTPEEAEKAAAHCKAMIEAAQENGDE